MTLDELKSLKEEIENKQIITAYNFQGYFQKNNEFFKNPGHFILRSDISKTISEIFDKSLELIEKEINKLKGGFNG